MNPEKYQFIATTIAGMAGIENAAQLSADQALVAMHVVGEIQAATAMIYIDQVDWRHRQPWEPDPLEAFAELTAGLGKMAGADYIFHLQYPNERETTFQQATGALTTTLELALSIGFTMINPAGQKKLWAPVFSKIGL